MDLSLLAKTALSEDSQSSSKVNDSTHFLPGNNFVINQEWRRAAKPEYSGVKVVSPGRLHFSVFDFSLMAPGLGGGGLGISTTTGGNGIELYFRNDKLSQKPTWLHLSELFKELVAYPNDDLCLKVSDIIKHTHSGLGSNVTFNTAVICGLNVLFGTPFSIAELWDIITLNFVENAKDNKSVYLGLDTGVGEAALLYGGIVWIESNPSNHEGFYLGNLTTDNLWVVTGIGIEERLATKKMREYKEQGTHGVSANTELDVLDGICRVHQKEYGDKLYQFLKQKLKPAFLRNDINEFFDHCWELNDIGTMRAMGIVYSYDIMKGLADTLRSAGALYAGLSSAGPGAFAFAASEEDARMLKKTWEDTYGDYFKDITIGQAGKKIHIDTIV